MKNKNKVMLSKWGKYRTVSLRANTFASLSVNSVSEAILVMIASSQKTLLAMTRFRLLTG